MKSLFHLAPGKRLLPLDHELIIESPDGFQVVRDPVQGALLKHLALTASTPDELLHVLPARPTPYTPSDVTAAAQPLLQAGIVVSRPLALSPDASELWSSLGLSPPDAEARALFRSIEVVELGAEGDTLTDALGQWGLSSSARPFLTVVVADDPLRPDIAQTQAKAVETRTPWCLVVPEGAAAWVTLFPLGTAPCWDCLRTRLLYNRPARGLVSPICALPPTLGPTVATRIARELARAIALGVWSHAGSWTLTLPHGDPQSHPVLPLPSCPRCAPASPARSTEDPRLWVSPVTGLVHSLHTVQSVGEPVVAAVRYRFGRRSTTLDDLMRNERHVAGGKGWRIEEAIRSAVFEALEHLSGVWRPSIPTRTTTASALGPTAILPQDVDGFSPSQRASPSPAGSLSALTVPHLLSPDAPIEWVEARPLAGGPSKWVPAAAAFYDAPFDGPRFALATSNGCAAGRNPEDAIWNGLVELIERDAVAIWWYNQIARPSLDPTSFPDPRPARFQAALSEKGRSLALFDITTDVGVPVVAAVSRRTTGDPTWVFGFGAAPTLTLAACRALTELAQLAPGADDPTQPPLTSWNTTATEVDLPHLATTSIGLPAAADDTPSDLPALLARLETLGVSAYAVDQTHPHIGVPVSRVIAPGLVHFWRRFGHSRLYETPVKLGWADAQRREEELSPFDLTI